MFKFNKSFAIMQILEYMVAIMHCIIAYIVLFRYLTYVKHKQKTRLFDEF